MANGQWRRTKVSQRRQSLLPKLPHAHKNTRTQIHMRNTLKKASKQQLVENKKAAEPTGRIKNENEPYKCICHNDVLKNLPRYSCISAPRNRLNIQRRKRCFVWLKKTSQIASAKAESERIAERKSRAPDVMMMAVIGHQGDKVGNGKGSRSVTLTGHT